MLRYVDETSATVWVRTADAARVTVERAGRSWSAATVAVHGSHYALVVLDGLLPGSDDTYAVRVDDVPVWPRPGMPPSRIRTLAPGPLAALRVRHLPHDGVRTTPRATGRTASTRCAPWPWRCATTPRSRWPDVLLLLGDQVYADTTPHAELEEFMAARRSLDEPPGLEIKDFVEYAELYRLAWSEDGDPLGAVDRALGDDLRRPRHPRRLEHLVVLATRDPHDDVVAGAHRLRAGRRTGCTSTWATSRRPSWREEEVWRRVVEHAASGATDELDLDGGTSTRSPPGPTPSPSTYRLELHPCARRLRAGRHRLPGRPRAAARTAARCSTPTSCAGSTACCAAGCGTCSSAPRCRSSCPPGLHDFEAMDEAHGPGRLRARRVARAAEKLRRSIDLEHWAAFNEGFDELFELVMQVARGERGPAPQTITFLSGDVHNSYLAEVSDPMRLGRAVAGGAGGVLADPQPDAAWRAVVMSLFAKSLVRPDAVHRLAIAAGARARRTRGR